MSAAPWVIGGGLALGAGLIWLTGPGGNVFDTVSAIFARGRQLTKSHMPDDRTVAESPEELAAAAGVDLNTYALARMLASEDPKNLGLANECRAWAACNDAARKGWSLFFCVTAVDSSRHPTLVGTFGRQGIRRYATSNDPWEGHLRLAQKVLADRAAGRPDKSLGAVKFLDAPAMGVQKGSGDVGDTVDDWILQGLTPYNVPGVTGDLIFFRYGGVPPELIG